MPTAPAGTKQRVTTLEADVKIMIERIEELESQVAHLQHSLSL